MRMRLEVFGIEALQSEMEKLLVDADSAAAETMNFVAQSAGLRAKNKIRQGGRSGRIYEIAGRTHQASAPGEPPANLTGQLADSITWTRMTEREGSFASAGTNDPKGRTLEFGGFNESGKYVEPRPFMLPATLEAIDKARGELKRRFEKKVRR